MIGIPFKMICNCNNSGGSGSTNPTPKQKFSANFGFVARLEPKTPTGVVAYTQVLIKNISLDGEEKEVEIELPYGYAGLSSIKALYIMCDKLGVTATEDVQGAGKSLKGHTHTYRPGDQSPTSTSSAN